MMSHPDRILIKTPREPRPFAPTSPMKITPPPEQPLPSQSPETSELRRASLEKLKPFSDSQFIWVSPVDSTREPRLVRVGRLRGLIRLEWDRDQIDLLESRGGLVIVSDDPDHKPGATKERSSDPFSRELMLFEENGERFRELMERAASCKQEILATLESRDIEPSRMVYVEFPTGASRHMAVGSLANLIRSTSLSQLFGNFPRIRFVDSQ
ncbi:hypothetical protein KBA73_03675 [Patescibacteria group bacterium]|nr:hypothetical protein [Patescibacteria group bacterium]